MSATDSDRARTAGVLEKKVKEVEITWATVDTDDEEELTRFEGQELEKAGQRIKKAAQEVQDLGIVDEKGRRVKKELPPDMQPGSDADV